MLEELIYEILADPVVYILSQPSVFFNRKHPATCRWESTQRGPFLCSSIPSQPTVNQRPAGAAARAAPRAELRLPSSRPRRCDRGPGGRPATAGSAESRAGKIQGRCKLHPPCDEGGCSQRGGEVFGAGERKTISMTIILNNTYPKRLHLGANLACINHPKPPSGGH